MILDAGEGLRGANHGEATRYPRKILRADKVPPFPDSRRPFRVWEGQMPGDGIFPHVWGVYHGAGHKSVEFLTRRIDLRWLHLE
jgi:hypothetical protein